MTTLVIEISNVSKSYGKGESKLTVLKEVSLTVEQGEFVAILGPSGSGKTTLMNIIGLIDTLDSGSYHLDGVDINNQSEKDYAKIRNEKIGFVFQKFNLISKYTALYNVALPLLLHGENYKTAKKKAMQTLHRVGLSERSHHRPNELSGGQQQRVAIARALIGECPLILADEPTGALDQKTGIEVLDFFRELNREGKTIVMITHDPSIASRAQRVVHVQDGKIIQKRESVVQ
ncbi:putative ABC transport system ATP-binding protein [Scopulibacillus darangshiensis]|uniref:Putative ABC transport system ATP-binding protein n=1 Tax=Scopulibacillus darangshiensis TaxID=442528 RepID=A0A4V6NQR2_9BACL|nr:ABC transporter ATP-binding protein [Scopulibacillus darangshiensis]TCP31766.1 putative ABC transport system ATP-binding protein [Scopulibacillus darangshiensis]